MIGTTLTMRSFSSTVLIIFKPHFGNWDFDSDVNGGEIEIVQNVSFGDKTENIIVCK